MFCPNPKKLYFFVLIFAFVFLTQCIDELNINIGQVDDLLVIDAGLIKNEQIQRVTITHSVALDSSKVPYVGGCKVFVEDELGNTVSYNETSTGIYQVEIDESYFVLNRQYRLNVVTKEGETYQSDWEILTDCPPIDTLYALNVNEYSYEKRRNAEGIKFYTNINTDNNYSRYYRWTMSEDWEYFVPSAHIGMYHEDSIYLYKEMVDSLQFCYKHGKINELYCASTAELTKNERFNIPLNHVFYFTGKLYSRYSLLLKQYSLTKEAYAFWLGLKTNNQPDVSLYQQQPNELVSNIKNVTNGSEKVFGYFWVATKTEKRFFYENPKKKPLPWISSRCYQETFYSFQSPYLNSIDDSLGDPAYFTDYYIDTEIIEIGQLIFYTFDTIIWATAEDCANCKLEEGINTPPDFWKK